MSTRDPPARLAYEASAGSRRLLLDHLVGRRQQRFRDGEAEGLGGLEVDDQLDLRDLLHGQEVERCSGRRTVD